MSNHEFAKKGDKVIINDGMSSCKTGPFFKVTKRGPNVVWIRPLGGGKAQKLDLHGVSPV